MKRSVFLTLCVIVCLALTLGGTIAYLTDTDRDVNVMTVGKVQIKINEFQRDSDNGLVDYEDNRILLPRVGTSEEKDGYGLPVFPTFHDKIVRVTSTSSNADAYLRVWIGVPTAVLNVNGEAAVHLVSGTGVALGDETFVLNAWESTPSTTVETTIDEVPYTMFCYNYTRFLTPGEVTTPVLAGLYLDSRVDRNHTDGSYTMTVDGVKYPIDCDLTNGLQVTVLAQAVQARGFTDAAHAFAESGMNDEKLFDEYLDLVTPVEEFTEQIKLLIEQIASALQNPGGDMIATLKNDLEQLKAQYAAGEITEEEYAEHHAKISAQIEDLRNNAPSEVSLQSGSYDLNGAAGAAMNSLAEIAQEQGNQVRLLIKSGSEVTIHLDEGFELSDGLAIANDGGELTIIGPEYED